MWQRLKAFTKCKIRKTHVVPNNKEPKTKTKIKCCLKSDFKFLIMKKYFVWKEKSFLKVFAVVTAPEAFYPKCNYTVRNAFTSFEVYVASLFPFSYLL